MRATLRRSLADGLVACDAPVDRVAGILTDLLAGPDDDWPLVAPLAGLRTRRRRGLVHGGSRALRGGRARRRRRRHPPCLRAASTTTLATEIRPAARPADRPGLCHVPGGEATYRNLVRVHTSLDVTPEELHRTGLARSTASTRSWPTSPVGRSGPGASPDALAACGAIPALHFGTRDEVFAKAASALERAAEAIPGWFGRLPQAPCEVVRMGAHEEEHSTIAYYRHPAEDGSRPGQYYINTAHPETRPRYEAEVLAYHESIPGHHLQIAIAQELTGLPAFRRHLGPTAFFEGWGLYTERLADEMGLYSGDLDRIGVLSFDAWRASRLVVDTGMHAHGLDAAAGHRLHARAHRPRAEQHRQRGRPLHRRSPGQALAYKTGQLELLRLRAEASERLGPAFDIRAFHDVVLGNGAIGLETVRGVVETWIAGIQGPARGTGAG